MDSHWRWAPAVVAMGAALLMGGATDGASAAALGCVLSLWLAVVILTAPEHGLRAFLTENAIASAAALAFVILTAASALPTPMTGHPLWRSFGFAGGPMSISPYRTWEGLAALMAPAASYGLGALSADTSRCRHAIARALSALGLVLAVAGVARMFEGAHERLTLNFSSANSAAVLFGLLSVLALANVLSRAARARTGGALFSAPLSGIALLACLTSLALTASRAGAAATALGFLVLCTAAAMRARTRWPACAAALLASTGVGLFAFRFANDRMWRLAQDAELRAIMAQTHWNAFLERMWFGHGLNTFHEINAMYATPATWPALHNIGAAHNIYIQLMAENGIVGAALLACMFGFPILRAGRESLRRGEARLLAAGAFAATVLALAQGLADFGLQTPAIAAVVAFGLGAFGTRQTAASAARLPAHQSGVAA